MENKSVKDLSIEELKEIIKEALVEALGAEEAEKTSVEKEENLLEEEFRLTLFENEED